MSFTYDLSTDVGRVRLYCMDNVEAGAFLEDEEISAGPLVDFPASITRAAAVACRLIAAKLGRLIPRSAMSMSDNPDRSADFYLQLAEKLEEQAENGTSAATMSVFSGGRSRAGKQALRDDSDKTQPSFASGQDDTPGTLQDGVTGRYTSDQQ